MWQLIFLVMKLKVSAYSEIFWNDVIQHQLHGRKNFKLQQSIKW
jgi:hypothetical protein